MRRRLAAVATVVRGGGGERWRTKTNTAAAIAVAMVEEAVVATAATAATVAEATAVETERQNSRAGILTWRNQLGYPACTGLISPSVCLSVCSFVRLL
jgi:hypothetical protein